MCVVTGPRIDLAIALIDRMKALFADKGLITFDNKETVIELNGVKIEAFSAIKNEARGDQGTIFGLHSLVYCIPPNPLLIRVLIQHYQISITSQGASYFHAHETSDNPSSSSLNT